MAKPYPKIWTSPVLENSRFRSIYHSLARVDDEIDKGNEEAESMKQLPWSSSQHQIRFLAS